jgi:hypothetical protein
MDGKARRRGHGAVVAIVLGECHATVPCSARNYIRLEPSAAASLSLTVDRVSGLEHRHVDARCWRGVVDADIPQEAEKRCIISGGR